MVLFEMLEDMLETPVFLGQFEHYLKKKIVLLEVSHAKFTGLLI